MFEDIRDVIIRDGAYCGDAVVMTDPRDVFGDRCYVEWRKKNKSPKTLAVCLFCGRVGLGQCKCRG